MLYLFRFFFLLFLLFLLFVSQDFNSTLIFIHQSFSTVSFHYLSVGINHRGFFFLLVVFKILSFESFWRFKYLWCTPQDLNIQRDEHTWCESAKIFLLSNYSVTHMWFKPLPSIGTAEKNPLEEKPNPQSYEKISIILCHISSSYGLNRRTDWTLWLWLVISAQFIWSRP